jgi:hypothetical protein
VNTVSYERLVEVLRYEPETGLFVWTVCLNSRAPVGSVAGTVRPDGYRRINIDRVPHMAHRLAWLYTYREYPSCEIDHINRNRQDNRICNLRLATSKQNKENSPLRSTNTSGHKGVHWDKSRGKWMAFIVHNKRFCNLGRYDDLDQAVKVADDARQQLFTHHVNS